jgi:predicted transcriptional regulator
METKSFKKDTTLFANYYIKILLDRLVNKGVLTINSVGEENVYGRAIYRETNVEEETISLDRAIIRDFYEFRNIANATYKHIPGLGFDTFKIEELGRFIQILHENNFINILWYRNTELLNALNRFDDIIKNPETESALLENLMKEKISFVELTSTFLLSFGTLMVEGHFAPYQRISILEELFTTVGAVQVIKEDMLQPNNQIGFRFEYRAKTRQLDSSDFIKYLQFVDTLLMGAKDRAYLLVVIFHYDPAINLGSFEYGNQVVLTKITEYGIQHKSRLLVKYVDITKDEQLKEAFKEIETLAKSEIQSLVFRNVDRSNKVFARNDHLGDSFDFKKWKTIIQLKPDGSPVWQFGLRFYNYGIYARVVDEERHGNANNTDVFLSISKTEADSNVSVNFAHTKAKHPAHRLYDAYNREEIKITLIPRDNGGNTDIKFEVNNQVFSRTLDLGDMTECLLFAWSDGLPFKVDVTVKKIPYFL